MILSLPTTPSPRTLWLLLLLLLLLPHLLIRRRPPNIDRRLLARELVFLAHKLRQRGDMYAAPQIALPTFDRVSRVCHPPPLLLRDHLLLFVIAALQLLDALVVVVDCGGEDSLRALLADYELVEVLFQDRRSDAGWLVGIAEWSLQEGLELAMLRHC